MSEAEQRDLYEPAGYVIRGTLLARHALDLRRPSLRWMKPILQALEKYAAHFQTSIVYAWTH